MVVVSLFLIGHGAWAAPMEVTLFPKSAQVTEVSRVSVRMAGREEGKAVFILPGQARPESLKIFPGEDPGVKISHISWRSLTPKGLPHDDVRRKQLRNLTEERKRHQATIKGLEARIAFWQSQTKAKTKKLSDAFNLSDAISRSTKKAWQEKMNLEGECEKLEQRIAALQAELKKPRETANADWEVSLSLTGLKPEKRSTSLRYSYILSDCGWTPLYRLEAKPGQERIEFSWEAEAWQNSAQDWNNVEFYLAIQHDQSLTVTGKLPEWRVAVQKTGNRRDSMKKEKPEAVAAPIRNPVAPFLRHLGQRSVPSGRKQVLTVESSIWPATFTHVLRPFSGNASGILAVATLPSPVQIPENPAFFLRDGVLLGSQDFGFSGQKKSLLFGSDPDISGEVKLLSDQGEAPVIDGGKQVWNWHWQVVLKNQGGEPVKVRVEEPVPQIRDRRIKCEVLGEPVFQEGQSTTGTRELDLPSGGSRTLETFVHITAPRDMKVDMSWIP